VFNDSDGVVVEAEGALGDLETFALRLASSPPPRARVERIEVVDERVVGLGPFGIVESDTLAPVSARVSPDLATCPPCLAEMWDPADRRFGYPFTNCTDCGPRYSIVQDVPYDRSRTTMSSFAMCARCRREFDDPMSRRFHAQPNACAACGPRVSLDERQAGDAIDAVVAALRRGAIVAVKGLGGFHLACDAADAAAIARLRERKRRLHKPFAVMFPDLASLENEAVVDSEARAALLGVRRPIVLVPRRAGGRLPEGLAPGLDELGVFLPYTPLHHLLLGGFGGPLVMTSGNLTEEPIAAGNDEARERLGAIADVFLVHDRDIHMRSDDSVVRVVFGRERVVRRARGHVPEAIALGFSPPPLLAVGADLKNTLCLTAGEAAIVSQHIGDLESWEAQQFFGEVRANLERLFRVRPQLVAHDLHPGYHSTALARRTGLPLAGVQHHHAHVASCLVENDRRGPVIGVAWDGTGYGPDGTVWGGEVLVADLAGFDRVGFIRPVGLPGGDAAVREPWRMALSHLMAAGLPLAGVRHPGRATVEAMLREGVNVVPTSSAGRLFDAVASLTGVRHEASYEGQAAIELEAISRAEAVEPYPFGVTGEGVFEIDPRPLVAAVVRDVEAGVAAATIGGRFHRALAAAIADVCRRVRARSGLDSVALSGGCFQSRLLTTLTTEELTRAGFEVLLHARVPANDGGIALGQAAVAGWRYITRGSA
jgi:hydrogenase maturation protein HypF